MHLTRCNWSRSYPFSSQPTPKSVLYDTLIWSQINTSQRKWKLNKKKNSVGIWGPNRGEHWETCHKLFVNVFSINCLEQCGLRSLGRPPPSGFVKKSDQRKSTDLYNLPSAFPSDYGTSLEIDFFFLQHLIRLHRRGNFSRNYAPCMTWKMAGKFIVIFVLFCRLIQFVKYAAEINCRLYVKSRRLQIP